MYIPKQMNISCADDISRFIQTYSFAAIITSGEKLHVTHLPFLLKTKEGDQGYLYAHMARVNIHWQSLENNPSLIIFSGPHGYISPSWYHRQPSVPTWNYTTVHVHGIATLLDDGQTRDHVYEMQDFYEPGLINSNAVSNELTEKLSKAIVAFKIKIESIEAKFKLSQNKSAEDQAGILEGLNRSESEDAQQLKKFILDWGIFDK